MKCLAAFACLLCAIGLAACGGGGSAGSTGATGQPPLSSAASTDAALSPNALQVVVDRGPPLFLLTGQVAVNTLFTSVTLCTPGSATACQTIDHVVVDTGSVGLRVMASALTGASAMNAVMDPATGKPLRECVQFADGYTWGSVAKADVQIGGRRLASLPLNVIGDAAAAAAPSSCVSGPPESTVTAFGANGVLGIGMFLQDCGPTCVSNAIPGTYYVCPSATTCKPTTVALDNQVANPVAALDSDNNGVSIQLQPAPDGGAVSASGTLYFGVGTQPENSLGDATLFTLDAAGTFTTSYRGASQTSFLDTGSNGYFFTTDALPACTRERSFYCPVVDGMATSVSETAAILGRNGATETVGFTVDNADQLIAGHTVLPGLAGPSSGFSGSAASVFDWGLPFFYGRTVHVLFEGKAINGTTGPAVGF